MINRTNDRLRRGGAQSETTAHDAVLSRRSLVTGGAVAAALAGPASAVAFEPEPSPPALHDVMQRPGAPSDDDLAPLLAAASDAQFLIVVESHNDHATPLLTADLFRRLQVAAGYQHMAIEQDPWGMERAGAVELRGRVDRIAAQARETPYNFTFSTDEELRLLAEVGAASRAADPIWGVDQAFGAQGPLSEARLIDPIAFRNAGLEPLLAGAHEMELRRGDDGLRDFGRDHFMSVRAASVVAQLSSLSGGAVAAFSARARRLLDGLERSARIYAASAQSPGLDADGVPWGLRSNQWREALMKASFMAKYGAVRSQTGAPPRVVVKAGYWHAVRGRGPGGVFTFGGFLHELAIAEGCRAVTVQILALREWWPTYESIDAEYRVLLRPDAMNRSSLVDLAPIRGRLFSGDTFGLDDSALATLGNIAYGVDYLLFTPSRPGGYDLTRTGPTTRP